MKCFLLDKLPQALREETQSIAMNGKEPPSINKKVNFMMLSKDLVLNCLARISRLYYPTLSLVSKSFRSLVTSPELYETRALLGRTGSFLYKCLWFSCDPYPHVVILYPRANLNPKPKPKPRWFIPNFLTNHTRKKKKKDSLENFMLPFAGSSSVFTGSLSVLGGHSRFVAVGSNIYHIRCNTTKFSFLDCRSHTWHEAPDMLSANLYPLLSVLYGKIYVADAADPHFIQFFDPKTQIWEYLQVPAGGTSVNKSFAMEGKLYLHLEMNQNLVYDLKENRWDEEELDMSLALYRSVGCVIDDVYYRFTNGKLQWYDSKGKSWRVLNGSEEWLSKVSLSTADVELADYGGKMALLWEKRGTDRCKIWCAEIALERRNEHEMWGKVECYGIVLEAPLFNPPGDVVAATV